MNCQDHCYKSADPRQVTRRWFFEQCGVGLGTIALGQLLQQAGLGRRAGRGQRAGPQAAAVRAEGQARALSLHGRGAQPSGALRQQAATGQVRRLAAASRADQGLSGGLHQAQLQAAGPQVQVPAARPERHRGFRAAAAPGHRRRRHRRRQGDGHRRVQPRSRADLDEHRIADLRPAEHGRLGLLRAGERVAGPARLRGLQHRQEGHERRQLQFRQRLLADGLPGRAVPHQRRPGALSGQPAWRRSRARERLAGGGQTSSTGSRSRRSAIPRSPPGSARTRWRSACSSRPPT